jgi:hypothetical protein
MPKQDRGSNRRPRDKMLGPGGVVELEEVGEMPRGWQRLQGLASLPHFPMSSMLRSRPEDLVTHGARITLSGKNIDSLCWFVDARPSGYLKLPPCSPHGLCCGCIEVWYQ